MLYIIFLLPYKYYIKLQSITESNPRTPSRERTDIHAEKRTHAHGSHTQHARLAHTLTPVNVITDSRMKSAETRAHCTSATRVPVNASTNSYSPSIPAFRVAGSSENGPVRSRQSRARAKSRVTHDSFLLVDVPSVRYSCLSTACLSRIEEKRTQASGTVGALLRGRCLF